MLSEMAFMPLFDGSTLPRGVGGTPWSYLLALFSDFFVAVLSAAHLMTLLLESSRKRRAMRLVGHGVTGPKLPLFCPLNIFRGIVIGFLLTIVLRAVPDVLWMLAWNEATDEIVHWFFVAEWVCDTLALFPFLMSLSLLVWGGQVIPQQLMEAGSIKLARPQFEDARSFLRLGGIVVVIAIGVTVGKAYG